MIHNIKIQYPYADAIINRRKTFEVRLNDRGYNVGDTIQFRVMDGSIDMPHKLNNEEYEITYVHSGLGLEKGFVVFGIRQKGMTYEEKSEIVIRQLREDRDRLLDAMDKIRAEIESMDFDFGDFYDHTSTIREMVLAVIDKHR